MSTELRAGDVVRHTSLGLGKVVSSDGLVHRVYFKDPNEPIPDRRVRQFKVPATQLSVVAGVADAEFDNLPPWTGDRFVRAKTSLTLQSAKDAFLKTFPQGLSDPRFLEGEVQYKRSAHARYRSLFLPQVRRWIAAGDANAIAMALDQVYGPHHAAKEGPDTRLNLLYQRVEEPAYFDALRGGGPATVAYAAAALDFIATDDQATFDRYLHALEHLPTRPGGAAIDLWTTLTWLPFVAEPQRHVLIKPTIVQAFASVLPFEIQYRSDLNYRTYARCAAMTRALGAQLHCSELDLARRPLDMIDVQSFMWVVERYQH